MSDFWRLCYDANTERLLSTRTYPGSLQSCVVTTPANARLNLAYTYQNNGNIGQMIDYTRTETLTYTYDELDRLKTISGPYSQTFDYNPLGNITAKNTTTTYSYNDTNHKHAVTGLSTGESYTYDANGNMITRVENGQTYTQTFDIENRLSSVIVGGQTTQFLYDGDGNLAKKVKPDSSKTFYTGMYEVDKSSGGTVTKIAVYYPVGGAMRINGTLYFILKDHLGSSSVVTDASGTIAGEDRFYPYGETRFTTGSMNTDKLFTGQREMTGLGIYHYGARFYSPKLGRFLSPDTIVPNPANPQSLNRFSYVRNNPLLYIDPTGHMETCGGGYDECGSTPPPPICSSSICNPNNPQGGGSDNGNSNDETPDPTSTPQPSTTPQATAAPTPFTGTPFPTDKEFYPYTVEYITYELIVSQTDGLHTTRDPFSINIGPFGDQIPLAPDENGDSLIPPEKYEIGELTISVKNYKTEEHLITVTRNQYGAVMGVSDVVTDTHVGANIFIDFGNIHCHGSGTGFHC